MLLRDNATFSPARYYGVQILQNLFFLLNIPVTERLTDKFRHSQNYAEENAEVEKPAPRIKRGFLENP